MGAAAASILVAGATFYLANRTHSMAKKTEDVAKATEREADEVAKQAGILSESLQATIRPWLTRGKTKDCRVTPEDGPMPEHLNVDVYLRNAGVGLALISADDCVAIAGHDTWERRADGMVNQPIVEHGAETLLHFAFDCEDENGFVLVQKGRLRVIVPYSDARGEQPVEAELLVVVQDPPNVESTHWRIGEITYRAEDRPDVIAYFEGGPIL